ncbi:cbb3-type cytochrome c oxidase subunit II [Caballeronia sp. DA-9]|uniref:cbb3-type cytochrome c oxidase subunit II n=1 Tax=Caballeronia sp. DA-9 TaxID=3436237 RepID=UPI003F6613A3
MSLLPRRRWFGASQAVLFIAGIGFFVLSVVALGILPGLRLERSIQADTPAVLSPYTKAQLHGRSLYATQGCAYCHSQQVRNIAEDVRRWGPPTQPWETKYDSPQLWGTRRIGPDLAREAGVRSKDWQLAHLYNPRYIVPGSIMPGYPWMFDGSVTRPKVDALDLVAYLETLGAARRAEMSNVQQLTADQISARRPSAAAKGTTPDWLADVSGTICSAASPSINARSGPVKNITVDEGSELETASLDTDPSRAHASITGSTVSDAPTAKGDLTRGQTLFKQSCAGCHGASGNGHSPAAFALAPRPADLTQFEYSDQALASVLENGVAGSSMPAWRDLSDQQVADLVAYVQTLGQKPSFIPTQSATLAFGSQLYAADCAACHGVNGKGDGPVSAILKPAPFDFEHIRPSTAELEKVLMQGVPASAMPAFPGLDASDRKALATFVRSIYQGPIDPSNRH